MSTTAEIEVLASMAAMSFLIFIAMLFVFSQLTGWSRLAKRYGLRQGSEAPFRIECVMLGELGCNSPPLWIGVAEAGLTLRPIRPFRPIFASLFIPWSEIASAERKHYVFFEVLVLRVSGAAPLVGFTPSPAADAIEARLPVPIRPAS